MVRGVIRRGGGIGSGRLGGAAVRAENGRDELPGARDKAEEPARAPSGRWRRRESEQGSSSVRGGPDRPASSPVAEDLPARSALLW